jgi:protein TonB
MAEVRANLFYEREEWKAPLMISVAFHFALVLAIVGVGYVMTPRGSTNWGTKSGPPVIEAQMVSSAPIPLPQPKEQTDNIVANDTKAVTHDLPQPKETETEDGITIKGKPPKKTIDKPITPTHTTPRPVPTPVDTAVPAGEGGPVSGPYGSFSAPNTKGGVSVQEASFGDKYPFYIKQIRDAVQRNWRTYEIDPRITAPHRAFIEFEIVRDGTPHNVQIAQSSGVPSLDISARRAIERIDGFGALPEGSVLHVQFWFDYPPK